MRVKCLCFFMLAFVLVGLAPHCAGCQELGVSADFAAAPQGDTEGIVGVVEIDIPPDHHAYAHDSADAGMPTVVDFELEGSGACTVFYPAGQLFYQAGEAESSIYQGHVNFFVPLPANAPGRSYTVNLNLLLCSVRNCTPIKRQINGVVPTEIAPASNRPWLDQWLALYAGMSASSGRSVAEESLAVSEPALKDGPQSGQIKNYPATQVSQTQENSGETAVPTSAVEEATALFGQEPDKSGEDNPFFYPPFSPRYADEGLEVRSLFGALIIGMLAGLLLNVMPCVLPVLSLKVSGLLLLGEDRSDSERLRMFREQNLCFAAGIFSLFTFLGLVLGSANLMWGQLFQNQVFLLLMLILVFLMALSLLGVFTLPVIDIKYGQDVRNPRIKSFITGLLVTFLATPCSGPLLGGVLAWAFTQPLGVLILVFWAIGLGMGLPYVIFSIWPRLVGILPRPGRWMYAFEHILGFCLMGTALYLLSILPAEKRLPALGVLLLAAFCAWIWGYFCGLDAPRWRRLLLGPGSALILALSILWILRPAPPVPAWREFTPEYFQSQLGRRNLLVEFTADWCPNCKFVESMVFTEDNLRKWTGRYDMELVRVDLTEQDDNTLRLLEAVGSRSIPLTVLFPAGDSALSPYVLRDVYGAATLDRALEEHFTVQ